MNDYDSAVARLAFWELGSYAKLDKDLLQQLSAFNFRNMSISSQLNFVNAVDVERFLNNVSRCCSPATAERDERP